MTKYAIVPVEATELQILGWDNGKTRSETYRAMLAVRPPLDAEMQQALEVARITMDAVKRDGGRHPELVPYPIKRETAILARALLRANGEDV